MRGDRTFLLVANRALADGTAPVDDLPGAGGRFDVVARFVVASLLTSHGIREETDVIVLFTATGGEPTGVRVRGSEAVGLRPDERSTAARLNKALSPVAMPVWQPVGDGIETRSVELAGLLDEVEGPIHLLHEDGGPLEGFQTGGADAWFVLGDQDGLTQDQLEVVRARAASTLSVGPVSLQADQVTAIVHNRLDRDGDRDQG